MKLFRSFILFSLFLTLPFGIQARPTKNRPESLPQGIQSLLQKDLGTQFNNAHIGILIQSMETGKILYRKNENHLFTPASVQKILVAVAALDYLKPDFIFKTSLYTDGSVKNHSLNGNLFIQFSGDPELKTEQLKQLIAQLSRKGVRRINGHVYIDNTAYSDTPYPPGWIWDDLSYSFAAPLNAIILNHNYYLLTLINPRFTHNKTKQRPIIKTNLPAGVANFSNSLEIINTPRRNCPIQIYSDERNFYQLRGCFYHSWKQQTRKIAIRNMVQYARILISQSLRENQIHFSSPITLKSVKKNARLIASHDSPPLREIVKQMLKESDNLTTNTLLKKIGERYFHRSSTWQDSLYALKRLLNASTGLNFNQNHIDDGSGLSRYNLLSPQQLATVLYFAYHNKKIKGAFMSALPIAGKDGTLENRLRDQKKGQRIHAKTGTMTGISALAGYVYSKHRGVLSFVILINGFVKPRWPYIVLENEICRYLVNTYG